ncbi:transposase [Colwellia sp. M166]|uniref:transposase n=1 Tax=Colwellia sp. M166 TaxID=2583805 RepID=UPI0027B8956B|nr:transposase [Colwellia sp. M166]
MITDGKSYSRFTGYLKDCRVCPLQKQCMRKAPKATGRQVQFLATKVQHISHSEQIKIKIDSSIGRR